MNEVWLLISVRIGRTQSMRLRIVELKQIMSGRGAFRFNCGWFECSQSIPTLRPERLNPSTIATIATLTFTGHC